MSSVGVMSTDPFVCTRVLGPSSTAAASSSSSSLPPVPKLSALSGGVSRRFLLSLKTFFRAQGRLPLGTVHRILRDAKTLLASEPSMVDVELGVNDVLYVCGDLHGQYYDLLRILDEVVSVAPSSRCRLLFNGDFVDRGSWGVETMLLLLTYKLLYPEWVYLNRGNHECEEVNANYGFESEVVHKYNLRTFRLFEELFNWLPVAHRVNSSVLIMHGGLPAREGVRVEDIRGIVRGDTPQRGSIMSDLLWADPMDKRGRSVNPRGYSWLFGPDVTQRFLEDNNLMYIVRSHECVHSGFRLDHDDKVITVFSAPNYCDRYNNRGAVCILHGDDVTMPEFKRFDAAPHPRPIDDFCLFNKKDNNNNNNNNDNELSKGRRNRKVRNVSTSPLLFRRGLA